MPKRKRCEAHQRGDLNALLAAAPLNGIELDRSRDLSRDVAGFGEDDAASIRDAEPLFRAGRNA